MNANRWERWAERALEGRTLHEPPEHLLRQVERAPFHGAPVRKPARTPAWPGWMRGLAAASIVGLAVIGGTLLLRDGSPRLPERGVESTVRGSHVQLLSPVGDLDGTPGSLAWRAFEGAASYRVSILAVDDEVLWSTASTGSEVELPAQTRDLLRPAVAYRWRVEALDADGAVIGRSESERFRIRP